MMLWDNVGKETDKRSSYTIAMKKMKWENTARFLLLTLMDFVKSCLKINKRINEQIKSLERLHKKDPETESTRKI